MTSGTAIGEVLLTVDAAAVHRPRGRDRVPGRVLQHRRRGPVPRRRGRGHLGRDDVRRAARPSSRIPLALVAGASAGALWASCRPCCGPLAGIDEVVTTLLLNPVALLLFRGCSTARGATRSDRLPRLRATRRRLRPAPMLFPASRVHLGFVDRARADRAGLGGDWPAPPLGLRITRGRPSAHGGASSPASASSALQCCRRPSSSGAIAGMGGAVQVMRRAAPAHREIGIGYGYTGIIVATLGGADRRSGSSSSRCCSATSPSAPRTRRSCSSCRRRWARSSPRCCCSHGLAPVLRRYRLVCNAASGDRS